ncbi:MAG: hypothetical protein LBJ95_02645 [Oscillospiraceae bacterium]|jgi:hypothetical protein|nr:hypothetical protein [Oscillospiraceae bacterium]
MNLNFRKLKNSLLSLGLSATLFCTAGLAGLPVFATDPNPEETRAYRQTVKAMLYPRTPTGVQFDTMQDWLHGVADVSTVARARGAVVGIFWRVPGRELCLNKHIMASD